MSIDRCMKDLQTVDKHYSRVYIGYTAYSLYLYLLYSSLEEIKETFFFVGEGIHENIRNQLCNKYYFSNGEYEKKRPLSRIIHRIRLRLCSRRKWPFLRTAQIFAQDHFYYSRGLIGRRKYTLIEDAPNIFTCHRDRINRFNHSKTVFLKGLLYQILENSYNGEFGDNGSCKAVLITNMESDPILTGKELIQVHDVQYWNQATEAKQTEILSVFNISSEDLVQLKKRKVILLSQNFATLGYVSEQELVDIYAERLKEYSQDDIVIKNHPLDRVQYQKYFPEVFVFDKVVPMQLMNLLDIRYGTVVTICSSAAFSFPYDIHIDWIGTESNPKLFAALGKQELKINATRL